jgi:hypothetical protein
MVNEAYKPTGLSGAAPLGVSGPVLSSTLRQTEHAFADDIVLNLTGAACDCEHPGGQHLVQPFAIVHGEGGFVLDLRVRSQQFRQPSRMLIRAELEALPMIIRAQSGRSTYREFIDQKEELW